jgi:hypothetical protein
MFSKERFAGHHVVGRASAGGMDLVRQAALLFVIAPLAIGSAVAGAGELRLLPQAVVSQDSVRVDDVAALHGFDTSTSRQLAAVEVCPAPAPGESRYVHVDLLRESLAAADVNLAELTIRGAVQCALRRPAASVDELGDHRVRPASYVAADDARGDRNAGVPADASADATMRGAIYRHFEKTLERFGGRPVLRFDCPDDPALALSGPDTNSRFAKSGADRLG